ncbi:MAG: hypothetical protein JNK87_37990 [Bryobacterales bacterium]|nr:hypothetical protein [Bryobacterales bacterium]
MAHARIDRLFEQLEQLDDGLRPGSESMLAALAARGHLLGEIGARLAAEPGSFDQGHLERLRVSWQTMERCRAEMTVQRSLLAAEYGRLNSEQQLHERISNSLCPDRRSWELAG